MRIGLFGGSFNPPHKGHREASLLALRRLRLDRVWWLVSPGNPLKDKRELAPLGLRLEAARKLARHPSIQVSALESAIAATYTFETISYLKQHCRGVHFVWLMGADNLSHFDRWKRWQDITKLVPIAIIDRPGATLTAPFSRAGQILARYRLDESQGARLATADPPSFIFLHGPRSALSSTALRANRA